MPYGENHCNQVGPTLHIDTWNATTKRFMTNKFKIENAQNHSRSHLIKNLYGCQIKLLVKNRPPESVAMMTADKKPLLKGSGGTILFYTMKRYNFTLSIKLAEDNLRTKTRDKHGLAMSSYTGKKLIADLKTGNYDLAFGVFSYLVYFSDEVDLSQYYLNENFALYVPCRTKKKFCQSGKTITWNLLLLRGLAWVSYFSLLHSC